MYKNFSVIIFIITIIYIIYDENYLYSNYKLPSIEAINSYMDFVPPLIPPVVLDISKRIFKNKIAQRIILILNILMLCYTIFLISIGFIVSAVFNEPLQY